MQINELRKKIDDLENELQREKDAHLNAFLQKEVEIRDLHKEIRQMMQDYQDLMDTKIQLDVEIEAYRRLLESEETRYKNIENFRYRSLSPSFGI